MGVDIWPWIFPPLRGDVSACTRQWARSGRGAASRIARHGQRSGYACGYGHGNRNGLARSRASLISSFFMVKALFCSTYSTSIVEEEQRAVFLHLFRGVVFLSFSAFSGISPSVCCCTITQNDFSAGRFLLWNEVLQLTTTDKLLFGHPSNNRQSLRLFLVVVNNRQRGL